jgi:ABC-type glycerol-3-phosphate transport system substrate-binding protein
MKVFIATVATVLMAASSPSVSFPMVEDNASATASSFQDLHLDRKELERKEECCESCENQHTVSTMGYSGGGREGSSVTPQHGVRSLGWDIHVHVGSFEQSDDYRNSDHRVVRILTWAESKPELQAYADLYRRLHPDAPTVRIIDVPSLKELDYEITSELRLGSTDFDGFVIPPLMMGGMLQSRSGQALAVWTEEEILSSTYHHEQEEQKSLLDDLLPYYRYNVATYGGSLRGLPILSGSQALLLFRKDYLDALNLPTPKTWEDWTIIASAFSDQKDLLLGVGANESDTKVYGACLGLLNEAGCRRRNSLDGRLCKSQTMTYLGMVMASMTQYDGNSTGYMLGIDAASPNGLDPLFEPTLERVLKWMENHVENSGPRSLTEDFFESMKHFRDGRCAWTISVDHDNELLKDDNIGFVPLPGSHQVLDRRASTKATSHTNSDTSTPDSMTNCTASCDRNCQQTGSAVFCPYAEDSVNRGRVNHVPFGAVDATVGTVSALISRDRQKEAKEFFKFVLASDVRQDETGIVETSYSRIQQPLTYSELEKSDVPNYVETMKFLTSSPNAAIPIRVPNAFNLLSNLDDRIYDYLVDGDYSDDRREQVAQAAEKSWHMMISMYNFRGPHKRQPTSMFHELSTGLNMATPALDLYIGWGARGVMWILAGLSCVISVCFALWVWTYQEERVIRGMFIIAILCSPHATWSTT